MILTLRRILYLTFIIAFLILAPAITLYTAGYRIDFKHFRLEKTGVLSIESIPRGVSIYLDDALQGISPLRIPALLSGTYALRLEKDGFYPWKKEVAIQSNLTTFEHGVVLFKQATPQLVVPGKITQASASPARDKLAYVRNVGATDELRLLNFNTKSDFLVTTFATKSYTSLEFASWSPDQSSVLIKQRFGNSNSYSVLDTNTLKLRQLSDITTLNFDTLAWDASNPYYFYGLRANTLYRIDTVTNTVRQLTLGAIADVRARGSQLLYITASGTERFLNHATLSEQGPSQINQIKLQNNSQFELQPSPEGIIILREHNTGDVFVITDQAFNASAFDDAVLLHDNATQVYSSDTASRLIYLNNFELWTYDVPTKQKTLITRYSQPIDQAAWYEPQQYVFYNIDNALHAIESTDDKIKNDVTLTQFSKLQQFVSDSSGTMVYLVGTFNNQSGIFSLEIQ